MMNRRNFLKSLVTATTAIYATKSIALKPIEDKEVVEPVKISSKNNNDRVKILFMDTHKDNGIDYLHGTAQLENDESTKKTFCFMIDPNIECDNDDLLQQMKVKLYRGLNNEYNGGRPGAYYTPNRDFVLGVEKRVIIGFSM